jgi:hypothetical protein
VFLLFLLLCPKEEEANMGETPMLLTGKMPVLLLIAAMPAASQQVIT